MLVIISALAASHSLRLALDYGPPCPSQPVAPSRLPHVMGLDPSVGVHPTLRPPQKKIGFRYAHKYASIRL